jgi:GT2 family glycosyltransferase
MITIIYSTHKDSEYNSNFQQHLLQTVGLKDIQIIEYENHNQYSLTELYNSGITKSIYNIVVCCHNDIKLEKNWGKKLLKDFESNPDYGIIGKAGSCYFPESGVYWERMGQTMVGQVYHHPDGQKKWLSKYSVKLPFLIPVVTIDGLFISFDKTKIKHGFDETIGRFHFYDHGFCIPNYLDNVKIGVTSSFEITHQSVGRPNQEFWDSKDVFLKKWGDSLPLDLKPSFAYFEESKPIKLKPNDKVAVIIPTKSNLNLLFNCINSFISKCDKNHYTIFIADTGSSDDEKQLIKEFIIKNSENVTIKLIEYSYYNFSKINNDVVKNHVSDEFEFLLFCNNDIVLLTDVINNMLKVHKQNSRVGTVGARLYFEDNTIQHDGVFIGIKDNDIHLTHYGFKGYYQFSTNVKPTVANTGALLMIRKNIFSKIGMFNERYISCLEDVELNLNCLLLGLENYMDSKSVAYHFESQTRNENPNKIAEFNVDLKNVLYPFVGKHMNKLISRLKIIQ